MVAVEPSPRPARASGAPEVLAVVVAHDPDDRFDQLLLSLARQNYPALEVLVVDAASDRRLESKVADLVPDARVVRLEDEPGYGPAANVVLESADRPALYLFCHDDVALAPDAVTNLLREVAQSGAGVVGPKLVAWDEPGRLQHVGLAVDKFAVTDDRVEPGEVDQEQHDGVRDVFAVPGACLLVRADLFEKIGGFDPVISSHGEDVDLCWRAQATGARVMVAPAAVARHVEGFADRSDVDVVRRQERHRLRTVLADYSTVHLARVLPQYAVATLVRLVGALLVLRLRRAAALVEAWAWNLRHLGSLRRRRRELLEHRTVGDAEVRRLQARGSIQARRVLRRLLGLDGEAGVLGETRRTLGQSWSDSPVRIAALAAVIYAVVFVFGSRDLITDGVPAVGEFSRLPSGVGDVLSEWWRGWRAVGMGDGGATPLGLGLIGLGGVLTLGNLGLVRLLIMIGTVPLGALGTWRLLGATRSRRAQIVGLAVYAAVPVPYNALREARWGALVAYAAAPYVLRSLAVGARSMPFGRTVTTPWWLTVVGLGVTLSLALAVDLALVALVPILVLGVLAGSVLTFAPVRPLRLLATGVAGVGIAALVHLPWLVDLFGSGSEWATVAGVGSTEPGDVSLAELFRFDTGEFGTPLTGWLLLVPAAVVLVVGRGWRLAWGVRGWMLAFAGWGGAWLAEWGALEVPLPVLETLLVPAALGLAVAAAMGAAAFDADVGGRLAWRPRPMLVVAGAFAVAIALGPALGASVDGRWHLPRTDLTTTLSLLEPAPGEPAFRTLWLGERDVMVLKGWPFDEDLVMATTDDGLPTVTHRWIDTASEGIELLRADLDDARTGRTSRLGAELATYGVRYVVVVERLGPVPFGDLEAPVDPEITGMFANQLDFERIEAVNRAVTIFENTAWAPIRAAVPRGPDAELPPEIDRTAAEPVLLNRASPSSWTGVIPGGREVVTAVNASPAWTLSVDGRQAPRRVVEGWANAFLVDDGGEGALAYGAPAVDRIVRLAQLGGVVVLVLLLVRRRVARLAAPVQLVAPAAGADAEGGDRS